MNPLPMFSYSKASFDSFAEGFSATRKVVWPEMAFFRDCLFRGAKVLDLGCGNGKNFAFFQEQKCESIGLDISPKLIEIASQNHPSGVFMEGDMRRLPFATGKFDAVFAIASLHHLRSEKDRKQTVNGAFTVLKGGGNFCGTVWNLHQPQFQAAKDHADRLAKWLPWRQENDFVISWGEQKIPRFYHAFMPSELELLLSDAGFTDIEIFSVKNDAKTSPLDGKNICFRAKKPERVFILGVPFDMPPYKAALKMLDDYSFTDGHKFITTPNPEICVAAADKPAYRNILNSANLSLPDGAGILWAGEYIATKHRSLLLSIFRFALSRRSRFFPDRVCGSDIFRDFCESSKQPIFLLGGQPGVAEQCAAIFRQKGADIVGTDSGKASVDDEIRIVEKINASGAKVLFVAFGAPKQEEWIYRNLKKMPEIRFAMGIGGSFDFVAGTQKRAPMLFRKMGIEWLWRLIREPSRRKRIFTAVFTFPKLVREAKRIRKSTK